MILNIAIPILSGVAIGASLSYWLKASNARRKSVGPDPIERSLNELSNGRMFHSDRSTDDALLISGIGF